MQLGINTCADHLLFIRITRGTWLCPAHIPATSAHSHSVSKRPAAPLFHLTLHTVLTHSRSSLTPPPPPPLQVITAMGQEPPLHPTSTVLSPAFWPTLPTFPPLTMWGWTVPAAIKSQTPSLCPSAPHISPPTIHFSRSWIIANHVQTCANILIPS